MPTFGGFGGFPAEAFTFFRQLKRNNNRDWFQPRKQQFDEHVKAPMTALVEALNSELARWAPAYVTDPKKAIYRIYRDTRFSKDKTPYKTHIAASFVHGALEKHVSAGFYVAVSPEGVDIGGGIYMPGPEELLIVRTLIASDYRGWEKVTTGKALTSLVGELRGDELTRVPKGFLPDHPAAPMLRKRQWYFFLTLDAKLAAGSRLVGEVAKRFRAMLPAVDFINAPLLAQRKKAARQAMMA
jgi:uncharacterized protein (TIGR02453 family)